MKSLIIPTPSIQEQTKIANFLSAIDEKINQTQTEIQQTEQYKKRVFATDVCVRVCGCVVCGVA